MRGGCPARRRQERRRAKIANLGLPPIECIATERHRRFGACALAHASYTMHPLAFALIWCMSPLLALVALPRIFPSVMSDITA